MTIKTLLLTLLKHTSLAGLAGVLVGLTTTAFLKTLYTAIAVLSNIPGAWALLPVALSISAWISLRVAREAYGQGLEHVVHAIHRQAGKINARTIPAKLAATLLTIGTGGSAGALGPGIQIGGGLTALTAEMFHLRPSDRRMLVMCGMSAGFASILGTPLAGAIFAMEVLWIGALSYEVLLPSMVSALVGYHVAVALGTPHWALSLSSGEPPTSAPIPVVILAGVVFGLCAFLFIEISNLAKSLSFRSSLDLPIQGALSGLIVVGTGWVFPQCLGLGIEPIHAAFQGQAVAWYAFFLKTLLTALTLSFGGSGGIILPICFVGTMAGSVLGALCQADPRTFAALGFVGLLAGAANTPLTAIVLALELFGTGLAPYAIITCAISYLVAGHRSAIPTQILRIPKHPFFHGSINQEIGDFVPASSRWVDAVFRNILGKAAGKNPATRENAKAKKTRG